MGSDAKFASDPAGHYPRSVDHTELSRDRHPVRRNYEPLAGCWMLLYCTMTEPSDCRTPVQFRSELCYLRETTTGIRIATISKKLRFIYTLPRN